VAAKPARLWAAVQHKLNQLAMVGDVSGFDYLAERISYLEREISELRAEIGAGQRLRNSNQSGVQSADLVEPVR
jgi:hypothetical protein